MVKNFSALGLTPVSGQSAPEAIVRRLTERITAGELKPGDRLPSESELARALGVAPMTLRNALASLREIGLVETTRGRHGGTYVSIDLAERLREAAKATTMTVEELRSLTDWRRAISGEAAYLAAQRGTAEDFAAIQAAADEFKRCTPIDPQRRIADARLHTLIAEVSKSADLVQQEIQIQKQLTKLILAQPTPSLAKTTRAMQHHPLVAAILRRDAEGARQETIEHVESTYDWVFSLITTSGAPVSRRRRSTT
ncbi:FadR/GntR family transcriptional regulator (plasmid) [Ralstonia sp. 25C]|uniref:FadR/GntR family transcriptional regulator n=1 Tax=Ralstonia sp. 25C TaxID=3447363 RepID=UPI003F750F53